MSGVKNLAQNKSKGMTPITNDKLKAYGIAKKK